MWTSGRVRFSYQVGIHTSVHAHRPHKHTSTLRGKADISRGRQLVHQKETRWLNGKESVCQGSRCRRLEFDPWVRKIPWKRKCNPLQYICLENPMDRGAWQVTVHGLTKNQTWLSYWEHRHTPTNRRCLHLPTTEDPPLERQGKWIWSVTGTQKTFQDSKMYFSTFSIFDTLLCTLGKERVPWSLIFSSVCSELTLKEN